MHAKPIHLETESFQSGNSWNQSFPLNFYIREMIIIQLQAKNDTLSQSFWKPRAFNQVIVEIRVSHLTFT